LTGAPSASYSDVVAAWENFYVIVGSAGAALIGIQFVVITLVTDMQPPPSFDSINAFGTPTVVHFSVALVISAIMSVPWNSLVPASIALTLCGLAGLAYGIVVHRRARRQTTYEPVLEDWIWFVILPTICYLALTLASVFLRRSDSCFMMIAAAALGLLLIGIHNAWDSITHLVVTRGESKDSKHSHH
jgi:hypothetical protein